MSWYNKVGVRAVLSATITDVSTRGNRKKSVRSEAARPPARRWKLQSSKSGSFAHFLVVLSGSRRDTMKAIFPASTPRFCWTTPDDDSWRSVGLLLPPRHKASPLPPATSRGDPRDWFANSIYAYTSYTTNKHRWQWYERKGQRHLIRVGIRAGDGSVQRRDHVRWKGNSDAAIACDNSVMTTF